MRFVPGITAVAILSTMPGCATAPAVEEEPEFVKRPVGGDAQCDAQPARALIGERADQAIGARVRALTGASLFRWAPPGAALTMDYRRDRVTVSYDENMMIDRITCG